MLGDKPAPASFRPSRHTWIVLGLNPDLPPPGLEPKTDSLSRDTARGARITVSIAIQDCGFECSRSGLSNAAPVIYFPGALIYSAGFNVNQNVKKNNISE
jgi:hypothetical protein